MDSIEFITDRAATYSLIHFQIKEEGCYHVTTELAGLWIDTHDGISCEN